MSDAAILGDQRLGGEAVIGSESGGGGERRIFEGILRIGGV